MHINKIRASKAYVVASVDDILAISIARGEPQLQDAEAQANAIGLVTAAHPGKCAWVCCIEQGSPKPGSEFQSKVRDMLEKAGTKLGAAAYVVEGSGVRSTFVRVIMAKMTALTGAPQPSEYYATIEKAEPWVRQLTGLPAAVDMQKAVHEIRSWTCQ